MTDLGLGDDLVVVTADRWFALILRVPVFGFSQGWILNGSNTIVPQTSPYDNGSIATDLPSSSCSSWILLSWIASHDVGGSFGLISKFDTLYNSSDDV